MSLTYYDYEAEMSDFADDLADAITQTKTKYPMLWHEHIRYDDGKIAIIHERRGVKQNWEHIAYGYYLVYNSTKHSGVRFWIGKIIYPRVQPLPNPAFGIWADGIWSGIIPHTIPYKGGII